MAKHGDNAKWDASVETRYLYTFQKNNFFFFTIKL